MGALAVLAHACNIGRPFPLILVDAQMPEMDGFTLVERIKQRRDFEGSTIMMLSSAGLRGDAARCRELGVAAYLTKPVRQKELFAAILAALGAGQGQPATPLVTRHSLREQDRHVRILLAEDNLVNQRLAVRMLERAGHGVLVVENGRAALDALGRESFDLVLMDVQMPGMDGLEATTTIRKGELATGAHIPIIALTAYAMKVDQERCIAAGMDRYLSKPVHAKDLYALIDELVPQTNRLPGTPSATKLSILPLAARALDCGIIDGPALRNSLEGDAGLLNELIQIFREDYPRMLAVLRAAIAVEDPAAINSAAHALKGSVSNFYAPAAGAAALQLEIMGGEGEIAGADAVCDRLDMEITRLWPALSTVMDEAAMDKESV